MYKKRFEKRFGDALKKQNTRKEMEVNLAMAEVKVVRMESLAQASEAVLWGWSSVFSRSLWSSSVTYRAMVVVLSL